MQSLSRSWNLAKLSFRVIGQDKELLLFPLIAMLMSLAYLLALLYPTMLHDMAWDGSFEWTVVDYILTFIAYLGLTFIGTFSNMCIVHTTKTRFQGGDATFGQSVGFTLRRIHQVLGWATVAATVGVIFRAIDDVAERAGPVGKLVVGVLNGLLGMVWSAITLFVIPSMVYRGTGPIDAIKDSVRVLKKTWGESLARSLGFGLLQFLFLFLGGMAFAGLLAGASTLGVGTPVIIALVVLMVVYLLGVVFVFMLATMIFNTALYAYASEGTMPPGYDAQTLQSAFRVK